MFLYFSADITIEFWMENFKLFSLLFMEFRKQSYLWMQLLPYCTQNGDSLYLINENLLQNFTHVLLFKDNIGKD